MVRGEYASVVNGLRRAAHHHIAQRGDAILGDVEARGGRHQHQAIDARRMRERGLHRDRTAHRMTRDDGGLDLQRIEERGEEIGILAHRVHPIDAG